MKRIKTPKAIKASILAAITILPAIQTHAQIPVTDAANTATNQSHQASTIWGWIGDRIEQLNHLNELIENNFLTKAIRGFNELMTAIQTDISEVLGTVETLMETPMEIFQSVAEIPNTVFGMLSQLQGTGSGFLSIYEQAMGIFDMIGEAQAFGKEMGDMLADAGGAYGFFNQVSGMRTALNSSWLKGSKERERKLSRLSKESYGGDAIQMQSTQNDILLELLRQTYRAQDMESVDRVVEAARDLAVEEQLRARTARTKTQTRTLISSQLSF